MTYPFFYYSDLGVEQKEIILPEETSRHIAQVLRMKEGEKIKLTDGKGRTCIAEITSSGKKKVSLNVSGSISFEEKPGEIVIAVSPVKNASRFEWFLEKATEIGVTKVIPLICTRTEKQNFKYDRMKNILVSAMLQSQQAWLPELSEPIKFKDFLSNEMNGPNFIAYCGEEIEKTDLYDVSEGKGIICIGPEGDFTSDEVSNAFAAGFKPVSLGNTRLRTETAALVAAVLLGKKA